MTTSNLAFRAAQLEAILDNAVDAIITINQRGKIESVNPATERMFGYPPAEIIGKNVKILMPAPYQEEHDGYLANYLNTGERKVIGIGREVVGRRKDGTTFPMELAVSESHVDEQRYFTGIVRDISERKRTEEERTSVGDIIEESLNEIFIFDADTLKFILVNRGGRENLGYTMAELHAMTPLSIKPMHTFESFKPLLAPLLSGEEEKVEFETIHRRKNGSQYHVEVHLQKSTFRGRSVFIAIILDITERKRYQTELEQLVDERTGQLKEAQADLVKQERLATLGQVSGGIAHEILNPLNAIKTSAYYLLNAKQPTPEKTSEHLQRIDRQVTLVDNVITALSDVARLPDPKLKPVPVSHFVKEALRSVSLPDTIETSYELPEGLPQVLVDENQIPIVLKNLLRNSRDAMPEGGKITITAVATGQDINISVTDTGVGISAEDLPRVMEPLFSTKARGMGLGLSICQAIVEKNEGTIIVKSTEGFGATFTLQLKAVIA